jgi:hypothetical protein
MALFGKSVGQKIISGDRQLVAVMKHLRTTAARRVTTAGAAPAAKELAARVKATVPSRFKGARKAIGWRRLKVKEHAGGGAKIGGRVGSASKASAKSRKRANRKGVGIGAQNIPWFFEDAKHKKRYRGKRNGPRAFTGTMLKHTRGIPSVAKIAAQHRGQMASLFATAARKQLKAEIKKGKAFAK